MGAVIISSNWAEPGLSWAEPGFYRRRNIPVGRSAVRCDELRLCGFRWALPSPRWAQPGFIWALLGLCWRRNTGSRGDLFNGSRDRLSSACG